MRSAVTRGARCTGMTGGRLQYWPTLRVPIASRTLRDADVTDARSDPSVTAFRPATVVVGDIDTWGADKSAAG